MSVNALDQLSLGALARRPMSFADFQAVVASLRHHSDREAAVVGAALLDKGLELAISSRFVVDNPLLYKAAGPLSTADGKLAIAAALGIIGAKQQSDIKGINQIRNVFAHSPEGLSFATTAIANRCQDLLFTSEGDLREFHRGSGAQVEETHLDGIYVVDENDYVGTHVQLVTGSDPKAKFLNAVLCHWLLLFSARFTTPPISPPADDAKAPSTSAP